MSSPGPWGKSVAALGSRTQVCPGLVLSLGSAASLSAPKSYVGEASCHRGTWPTAGTEAGVMASLL